MILVAIVATVLPAYLMYLFISKENAEKPGYSETCKSGLIGGVTVAVPVFLMDLVLVLIGYFTHLSEINPILWDAYKTWIMFALAEELWKFVCFRGIVKKSKCEYSWYDLIAFMVCVGLGFEINESIVGSISTGPIQAVVRGITMMHGVFGFIMGYFYGKGMKTGKKGYYVLSFLLPYLCHAVYDFTLSSSLDAIDWIAIIPVTLAFVSLIMVIVMIRFFKKAVSDEKYTAPLVKA